jgi:hypothetical protein
MHDCLNEHVKVFYFKYNSFCKVHLPSLSLLRNNQKKNLPLRHQVSKMHKELNICNLNLVILCVFEPLWQE